VVTWNGNGADIPQLRIAIKRHNLRQGLDQIESRHLDLYQDASKSLRLPILELALKPVASYFAIPKVSRIRDGLEAMMWFQQYRKSQDESERDKIKTKLVDYNREDLEALVGVAEHISGLRKDRSNSRRRSTSHRTRRRG